MNSVATVYAAIYVKVGSVYEKTTTRGLSHFTEHVLLLGTQKHPTNLKVSQGFLKIGANNNGFTNNTETAFWASMPYINLSKGLDLLHQIVFKPTLDEKAMQKEKSVVLSEFNDFWQNPEQRFWQESWQRRFKNSNHPYGFRPLGKSENISNFTKFDIVDWRNRHYKPNNMILSIGGRFDQDKLLRNIERLFGKEKKGATSKEPEFSPDGYSDFSVYNQKETRNQILFSVSFPALGRKQSPILERMTLAVLNFILGSGSGSRLYERLRNKEALVYSISSSFTVLRSMGVLRIEGSTSSKNLVKALKAIKSEIEDITRHGFDQKEFNMARKYINYSQYLIYDNPSRIASRFAEIEIDDEEMEMWFPEKYEEESKKIKLGGLRDVARKIFDLSRVNINLLGEVSKDDIKSIKETFKSSS